jgi:hypothetical protein
MRIPVAALTRLPASAALTVVEDKLAAWGCKELDFFASGAFSDESPDFTS